jgi:acetyl-CoA carboxylase biotin carboxyl carrier protein
MIDFKFLEKLLDLLNRSDAHTIEIRKWGRTVRVSKGGSGIGVETTGPTGTTGGGPGATPVAPVAPVAPVESPKPSLVDIKSPMVGTFYAQPEPGADPYVRVGSRIKPGQTLCIIEAMKIMNPLDAEVAGLIREIAVQDAQPVEFGQVLFRVDPHG